MKKKFYSVFAILLIISQIFALTVYAQPIDVKKAEKPAVIALVNDFDNNRNKILNQEPDILIDKETYYYSELYSFISNRLKGTNVVGLNSFASLSNDSYIYASRFVPSSATINELSIINNSVILGYLDNSKRYIIELFSDGSIRKTISKKVNNVITVYSNFNNLNFKEIKSTDILTEQSGENIQSEKTVQILASAKTVDPKPVSGSYPPYKAKKVYQANYYFPSLNSLGLPSTQPVKVYETMDYYSEANKKTTFFDILTNITSIASFFEVAVGTATGWLSYAGIALDIYNRITEACKVINEHSYSFYGGKEGTVYDPTTCKCDVEVYSQWDEGLLTLTWQYNSSTGFKNPTWGISSRPSPFLISNSTFAGDTAQVYNNNIYMYGNWKWGKGELGY